MRLNFEASYSSMRGMKFLLLAGYLIMAGFLAGCLAFDSARKGDTVRFGESLVLAGEEPGHLAFLPQPYHRIAVRSTYRNNLPETIQYQLGIDYLVDHRTGRLRRTSRSRIPDFQTNMLYGVKVFDHSICPGFGNTGFFVFVDYTMKEKPDWPRQSPQTEYLPMTLQKLRSGEAVKIVAYGDSITAGGDATAPGLIFWQRWADELQGKYRGASVSAINGATGGDTTRQGLARLDDKVLKEKPDLVLVGFGMNDHNIGGFGTPVDEFARNLETIIDRIRQETGAEIILFSTFPPNPNWHYGSRNMAAYASATERVASEKQCAFADIYGNWIALASRKKPEDLLGNNINHPNDFGHWMYYAVLTELGL